MSTSVIFEDTDLLDKLNISKLAKPRLFFVYFRSFNNTMKHSVYNLTLN